MSLLSAYSKSNSGNLEVVRAAIFTLAETCRECEPNKETALHAGCIPALLKLISVFTNDAEAQLRVVHLVSAYASDPRIRNTIRDERGVHALVELLFSYNQCIFDFILKLRIFYFDL